MLARRMVRIAGRSRQGADASPDSGVVAAVTAIRVVPREGETELVAIVIAGAAVADLSYFAGGAAIVALIPIGGFRSAPHFLGSLLIGGISIPIS